MKSQLILKRPLALTINYYLSSNTQNNNNEKSVENQIKINRLKMSGSSRKWMIRHLKDPYVVMASAKNYRARSAFKLIEIDDKFHIFEGKKLISQIKNLKLLDEGFANFLQNSPIILDCGASPGSWSQVALERSNNTLVIAFDKIFMDPLQTNDSCHITLPFQDMNDPLLLFNILKCLYHQYNLKFPASTILPELNMAKWKTLKLFDIILSDMAPNATGIKSLDHQAIMTLCLRVYDKIVQSSLKANGHFVIKVWDGYSLKEFISKLDNNFQFVKTFKPNCSREESSEIYIICKNFKHI